MHNHTIFICFIFLLALLTQAGDAKAADSIGFSAMQGAVKTIGIVIFCAACGLLIRLVIFLFKKTKEGAGKVVKEGTKMIANMPETLEQFRNDPEPQYYAQAEQEIIDGTHDKGLSAKAFTKAKGNEDVRKAEYVKLRAKELQLQHNVTTENFNNMNPDPQYFAQAEQEVDDRTFDKGLWSIALVNANGNEELRKIEYMKLRAMQLQKQQQDEEIQIEVTRLQEEEKRLQEEKIRLQRLQEEEKQSPEAKAREAERLEELAAWNRKMKKFNM